MFNCSFLQNAYYTDIIFISSNRAGGASCAAQSAFARENYSKNHRKIINRSALDAVAGFGSCALDNDFVRDSTGIATVENAQRKISKTKNVKKTRGDGTFTQDAIVAARRRLKELITCNLSRRLKFLTLTENEEHKSADFASALKAVQNFERRLKRFCASKGESDGGKSSDVKCIFVPERGEKNGRLHWHVIALMPYIKKNILAEKIWGRGFVDVKSIRSRSINDSAKQISAYVSKYITSEIRPIVGRKMIFYGSKNWKTTKTRYQLSPLQAQKFVQAMNRAEDCGRIDRGFWSFCNYRNAKPDELLCEKYRARRKLPSAYEVAPADCIKITWRVPTKKVSAITRYLQNIYAQKDVVNIIGKNATQRVREGRRKKLAQAFVLCRENPRLAEKYTRELAPLFPRVNAGYIYGVLRFLGDPTRTEDAPNNFDVMDDFGFSDFALSWPKNSFLKSILFVRVPKARYFPLAFTSKYMVKFRYCEGLSVAK